MRKGGGQFQEVQTVEEHLLGSVEGKRPGNPAEVSLE